MSDESDETEEVKEVVNLEKVIHREFLFSQNCTSFSHLMSHYFNTHANII